jgi:hypothetical protein
MALPPTAICKESSNGDGMPLAAYVMEVCMKIILLATVVLSLCGCTTVEFVRKDLTPEKQALIRYPPQTKPEREAKYRADMNKKVASFCGGAFDVTKEYQAREQTGTTTGFGTGFGIGMGGFMVGAANATTDMYNFVEVKCR